ncbi:hypothetical protein [Pseudoxanthomonas sp. CF125]|uniref:hypothetical protein n=1 Tax=Pseudoxanthomonas sp. CF125 TaxID=1855303 RepID=UPI000886A175|nr:hypothetical protein [Pseudoxanthomonas sp. CF125]SDR05349.1 hypothetical protein SAMN05216569_2842 [Pseudoxanthomonas sp. CF125]
MHKYLVYAAYGWLTLSGTLHFVVDVVSQHLRGKRTPGLETTLYYGLNSAFSLGQVVFGLLGLFLAWRHIDILSQAPVLGLSLVAGIGWLALTFLFMGYWEPKLNVSVYCILILAVIVTR